ncbi:uncharacterized protein RSE6_00584 [Rhynchosporium secalis]|uniref:Uncharacterized protein n=1 Tax=Rhynchosporium secalis TaxID=38038 RepID=A0A1E1LVM5_RHYSE|nr:uncharacterized protein RSE6_00584 [Rhynchosporium secalis]
MRMKRIWCGGLKDWERFDREDEAEEGRSVVGRGVVQYKYRVWREPGLPKLKK